MADYQIENAQLNIKQDTIDLKKFIFDQISSGKSNLDAKDITISQLKKEIDANTYNNKALFEEVKIIFPEIESISISNHRLATTNSNSETIAVLIYSSKTELSEQSKLKLKLWMQKRISKDKVAIYKQESN